MNNKDMKEMNVKYLIRNYYGNIIDIVPEDTTEMIKLLYKDQFGLVEFQGDIISSTKRDRLAHCLG